MGRLTYFTHEVPWDEFCCGCAPHQFNSIWILTFTQFTSSLPALLAAITRETVGLTGGNVVILLHSDLQNCSESVRSHWHQVWASSVPNRVIIVFSLAITAFTSLSLNDLRVIVWLLSLTALLENTFLSHSSAEDWIRFCSRISSYYNAIIVVIMTPVEMVPFRHPFNINSTLIVWKFNVVPSDQCLSLPQVPQAWFSPKEI